MILSNGISFEVPGKNLTVSASLAIDKKALGGDTSGTDNAEAGIKPQRLSCSLLLPKDQAKKLKQLKLVVTGKDTEGAAIVDDLAEAMDIRQVRFVDGLNVTQSDGLQAWNVTFTLEEVRSVAERREEREKPDEIVALKSDGTTIAPASSSSSKLQQFMNTGERAFA
jgi:FlaA1/EpsC-like NDP-sugar epimerase